MALTKYQLAQIITDETGIKKNLVVRVLNEVAVIAAEELEDGEDFRVPGVISIAWRYTPPKKKGERWKKGDERTNRFTGEVTLAESDSPPVKARISVSKTLLKNVKAATPLRGADNQAEFAKTQTAKLVRKRKV
jgi:nucleoid DNA-binding protein